MIFSTEDLGVSFERVVRHFPSTNFREVEHHRSKTTLLVREIQGCQHKRAAHIGGEGRRLEAGRRQVGDGPFLEIVRISRHERVECPSKVGHKNSGSKV